MKTRYINEIVEWNKKFNLTGLKTAQEIQSKLYDDSLNVSRAINLKQKISIIDIGCGAGFPGIPLKIEFPDIQLTLVDSVKKKIEFIRHVISMLGLTDTKAIAMRAEDLGQDMEYREKYDICVSRAVAALNILSEYCLPFVKPGGLFIAQKGPDIAGEVLSAKDAISMLGGQIKEKLEVASGYIVVVKKIGHTPQVYPRKAGTPGKRPL